MKRDCFFAYVVEWMQILPGLEDQSQYLLSKIVDKVPLQHCAIFTNDTTVADDGFKMLHRLLEYLQGNTVKPDLSYLRLSYP